MPIVLRAHPDVAALLRGRGVHLGVLPAALARHYGPRVAVDDAAATPGLHAGGVRTFDDLESHTALLAAAHRDSGRGPDERVLVVVGNRIDAALHVFALGRIGAVPCLVNPRLTADEVAAVAAAAGATTATIDEELRPRLGEALDGLQVTTTEQLGALASQDDIAGVPAEAAPARVRQAALLLTTSGTTGLPKAAALTSRGLLGVTGRLLAVPVGRPVGLRADRDRTLAALPLSHVMGFGVLLACLCAGVPLHHRERFDAGEVLSLIERERPNSFVGVPTMYADLEAAGAADRDLASVQLWVSAADAMAPERARRFQRFGRMGRVAGRGVGTAAFLDVYGMVELSGAAAVRIYPPSPTRAVAAPPLAVVLPGVEARTVDEHGRPVGRGEVGELQFRGSGVLQGYEGDAAAGPDAHGWFGTGDHARLWPGRVFSLSGRSGDRLKVGGFSVFPAEVEEQLMRAPGVGEVALVGVPDDRLGERPVALVVPADDRADAQTILEWAQAHIAGYRRPRQVRFVDSIPRGNHGKVARDEATRTAQRLLEEDA